MAVSTLVNTIGTGMLLTASVLYFTRVVHLSAARVGLGLSLAGLVGVAAGLPVGDLADRRGPREVQLALLWIMAATMTAYLFIHSFAVFVVVVAVDQSANNATTAVRGGLIRRVGGEGASAFRARLRAVTNAGIGLGTLFAAAAIQFNTPTAYRVMIIGNALSFVLSALILRRLPHLEPLSRPERESRWGAARDLPFNAWAIINGLMSIHYSVLLIPLPLWIVGHTHAPRWSVACGLLINTVICVCFQVRVGGRVRTMAQGAAAYRTAGLLFLVSCPLLGLLGGLPAWSAVLLLAIGCAVHTVGELWQSSGQFALGYDLAPAHAQSQYQGMMGLWSSLGLSLSPALLTLLCVDGGRAGWTALGVFFALLGLAAAPAARWAERTRAGHVVSVGAAR
jgi:MFS family permease